MDYYMQTEETLIEELARRCGGCEVKEIPKDKAWCISVTSSQKQLPLAAIGQTPRDAAIRLLKVVDFGENCFGID